MQFPSPFLKVDAKLAHMNNKRPICDVGESACLPAANPSGAVRESKRQKKDDVSQEKAFEGMSGPSEEKEATDAERRAKELEKLDAVVRELFAANQHLHIIRHVVWRALGSELPGIPNDIKDKRWGIHRMAATFCLNSFSFHPRLLAPPMTRLILKLPTAAPPHHKETQKRS